MNDEKPDNGEKPKAPQWLIDNIAEASKNTRKIYLLYLGFLAYCALTAISTTDRTLVLNEPAHLPIVNVGVPLEGFFFFAPILAIFTFVYLQLNLQNLNGLKSKLRKDYPHVKKERIYPWLINVVDNREPGAMGVIQRFVVSFSLWWSLIVVLIIFALYYVKKHDIVMSYILGSLPVIGTFIVFWFRSKYESLGFRKFLRKGKMRLAAGIMIVMLEIFFLALIIPWSMEGGKYYFLEPWLCVDLSYQKLVTEPETDYEGLYWADFNGVHLEGANLTSAILKRADLSNAHLEIANLNKTNLFKADLEKANLQGADGHEAVLDSADLSRANLRHARFGLALLRGAVLDRANLQGAYLASANLQEAHLFDANLKGAVLSEANFKGAVLYSAELQGANLEAAELQGADLQFANLQDANLVNANLQGAFLLTTHLQEAILHSANLQDADLTGAHLQEARLWDANLQGADLEDADLQGAFLKSVENLTIEQLEGVKTLYEARLDSALFEQVKIEYPHLLEPPEEEEEGEFPFYP